MTTITLAKIGTHQTVSFAVDELARYLKMMDKHLLIDQRTYDEYDADVSGVIWIGLTPDIEYSKLDDKILVNITDGAGILTGSNERSILLGVYRFLYTLGCRWIFPGIDGEIIPKKKLDKCDIVAHIDHTPSARYRTVSIEGNISYEHSYDMVNWLPKVGFNTYYMQFKTPYTFWKTWYNHTENPEYTPSPITNDDAYRYKARIDEELTKRSFGYIALGHGYSVYPFGVDDLTIRDPESPLLTDEIKSHYALLKGERKMNRAINATQLCYSRPEVRRKMVEWVVQYCKDHPEITVLSMAPADGCNNWCECDDCKDTMPADQLMEILNEIDAALTAAGLDIKMRFSIYNEATWPPVKNKLNNPSRFMMSLCPSSRAYDRALCEFEGDPKTRPILPFVRNNITTPRKIEDVLAHFEAWKRAVPGTEYFFTDYVLMWEHHFDLGYNHTARVLHKDVTNLDTFGFSGFMNYLSQRFGLPTNLPLYAMAAGLWDKNSKFEDIQKEYYTAAFGEYADTVCEYMDKLEAIFDSEFLRYGHPEKMDTVFERMEEAHKIIDEFDEKYITPNKDNNASWYYLSYYVEYVHLYAELLCAYKRGGEDDKAEAMQNLKSYLYSVESDIHRVFDVANCLFVLRTRIPRVFDKTLRVGMDF